MNINFSYEGVNLDVNLKDRICFFIGNSGIGKTFLFTAISSYCEINDIPFCSFNSLSKVAVRDFNLNTVDLVIMDNADLYMNRELYLRVRESKAVVLICMKAYCGFDPGNSGEYKIDFDKVSETLRVKRVGV